MAAAAMFEIPDCDANWYTDEEKHAEFKIHNTGSVDQISRWPPPPF
jgi:hypothetical protein